MGFLDGVKVIDATRLLPGGYCTMLLSDLGAEVVKVEQPGLGDYLRATPPTRGGRSPVHESVNRNKMSIGIDLKREAGRDVLRRLLRDADVFVEGFRPGAMKRLGFSFEQVKKVNQNIVYCSISAFGQRSRLSSIPGHDINFQAMAGTLSYARSPSVPLLQLGDMMSALFATIAVLGALSGKARPVYIDVPIVQSLVSSMVLPVSSYIATGDVPKERSSLIFGSTPYYNLYRTSDDRFMAVAAIEQEFWSNLVKELGVSELEEKRFGSMKERRHVARTMASIFRKKPRDYWSSKLMFKETCVTPVLDLSEALDSHWAKSESLLKKVLGDGIALNSPFLSRPTPRSRAATPAPSLGQDTDSILSSLGFGPRLVRRLRDEGVVE